MDRMPFQRGASLVVLGLTLSTGLLACDALHAQDRRHEVREPYRADHWIYDSRFNHGHYYPSLGYRVGALPPGYLSLSFGNQPYFFQGGVWYGRAPGGFAVVRPPVGIVVPVLPPGYSPVVIGGSTYYYADETYYVAAPGGYAVAQPPAAAAYTEAPGIVAPGIAAPGIAAPPPAPAVSSTPPAPSVPSTATSGEAGNGMWYYCESSRAYYPTVPTCAQAWRPVPAAPQAPGK